MNSKGSVDCIVVGGGLVGMLSAWFLVREGLAVAVLERGGLCRESSWAGGGIVSPLVPWEYPDGVTSLVAWSQRHYPQLVQELLTETGTDPEWTRSGMLLLDTVLSADIAAWCTQHLVEVQVLEPAAVRVVEPALAPADTPGLLLPAVAQLRNPRLCAALRHRLLQLGVQLHEQSEVLRLRHANGRVLGVETAQGSLPAARVVIAGGAWSGGLWPGPELPLTPVRGQMIQFQASPGLLRHVVQSAGYYLIPRRDGLVLAGSTLEYVGFDKSTTAAARDRLQAQALRIAPALAECPVVRHWAGLRPGTPDGIPYICEHNEIKGLYLNAGHFRNGVVMGPASARILADLVLGCRATLDERPYACAAPVS
ncbi:MAG: glycine oxidase ThiO [Pseudomonadota bacterium]